MKHLLIDKKITDCTQCFFVDYHDVGIPTTFCTHKDVTYPTLICSEDEVANIPDWCPLEDLEQEEEVREYVFEYLKVFEGLRYISLNYPLSKYLEDELDCTDFVSSIELNFDIDLVEIEYSYTIRNMSVQQFIDMVNEHLEKQ